MKIARVESQGLRLQLSRPYAIAYQDTSAVDIHLLRLTSSSGHEGLGAAAPATSVTGETAAACAAALAPEHLQWLCAAALDEAAAIGSLAERFPGTPAARAAVDMALHDLWGRRVGQPVAALLGGVQCRPLPTSVTIGIKSVEETLADARDYMARGFQYLKVKIGRNLQEDLERLHSLRRELGPAVALRVDANQGYGEGELRAFLTGVQTLGLELVEQPLTAGQEEAWRSLPEAQRRSIAADESLHDEADARALAGPPAACGILNIKLMKCGGIGPALVIAEVASSAAMTLMWGCNDESVISISAALHVAYASPATRYLDLDGSLDLLGDPGAGGFTLDGEGRMHLTGAPGLGVNLADGFPSGH